MNKTSQALALFTFLVFLASCSTSSQTSNETNRQNSSNEGGNNSSTSANEVNEGIINIPSTNEVAPPGILEQLTWTERGGGEGSTPTPEPFPLCSNCDIRIKDSQVVLTNFNPNQKVRIVFYKHSTERSSCGFPSANYLTKSDVQVDKNGNFTIQTNGAIMDVFIAVAFDLDTGQKIWVLSDRYGYQDCNTSFTSSGSCPGAPPQRLQVNAMAYVCTQRDSVKLRSDAGKQYSEIKSLVPGADLTIIGGPVCADNWSWWQVKTESGYIGWMSEGGDEVDEYFLCPK